MTKHRDGFEEREALGDQYWDDPRWADVQQLRNTPVNDPERNSKYAKANGLVSRIREDWGVS